MTDTRTSPARVSSDRNVAGKGWDVRRGFVGLVFVAAAAGNFAITLWNPDPLFDFLAEDVSLWPFNELMVNLIAPNEALSVFVAVLFELAVGVLVLSRGRWVDLGLVAALGFQLFLIPYLMPFYPYAVGGILIILAVAPLMARTYSTPLWSRLSGSR